MDITLAGKRRYVTNVTLPILNDEDAWVSFRADDWDVNIHVMLEKRDDVEGGKSGLTVTGRPDHSEFRFYNWTTSANMTIDSPLKVGFHKGTDLIAYAHGEAVSPKMKVLTLFFYWAGKFNE